MKKHQIVYLTLIIAYMMMASCTKKQSQEIKPDVPVVPITPVIKITYANFAESLFQSKCSSCHASGKSDAGFFTLNGYASIKANAERIKQAVLVSKRMPKAGSLSATELQSLSTWFDNGMPEN
ncbi:putative membrane protein [Pedobacter sp. UYP24]